MPTEETRAVATGQTETKPVDPDAEDLAKDLVALAKSKPLFVYYYVDPVSDPMDPNYKLSRKFELSVLGEEICEVLNKNFVCKKVSLPAEADMKLLKNQARIEIWSPTEAKVGLITVDNDNFLNKSPFLAFLKTRAAKSEKLVKVEIARIQRLRKERDEAAKKETAQKSD